MATSEVSLNSSDVTMPVVESPRDKWVAERKAFLGGSEAYKLLNQPQYGEGCAQALAFEKLGVEPDYPKEMDEDLLRRGTLLEPLVATQYMEETGRRVISPPQDELLDIDGNKVKLPRARKSKEFPWAGVHVDRTILAGSGGVQETGDMEIKSRGEGPYLRVLRQGPFAGDLLQVQWANFVTGHTWGAFAMVGVFGGLPLKHYDIARNNDVIDIFKREGERFANHVWGKGEPLPERPLQADDARCKVCSWRMECRGEEMDAQLAKAIKAEKASKGELVTIQNPQLTELLTKRVDAKKEIALAEEEIDAIDNQIVAIQGVTKAYVTGFGKSYVTATKWSGLDQSRLKVEKPEIYQQYFISGRESGGTSIRTYPEK